MRKYFVHNHSRDYRTNQLMGNKMTERNETDMREYGMDYDKRLSIRVHQRHINNVDALAAANNKTRAEFMRELIDSVTKRAKEKGVI